LGAGEAALLFDGRPLANLGAGVRLRVADIAVDDLSHGVPLPSDAAEALLTPPLDLTPFRYLQPLYLPSLSAGPDAGAVLAGTRP
jgi:hypothetical protein